ncbi:Response regulator [Sulfidibacter corallicola]|uniref:Response regulator n=1 Tax=Sulfidibacter corallicola TaxID=2818388 RepID=A0A8A4TN87_SULCO|nr:response regulator [Sulfidibacter corallicola]QTD51013.1 response regulator [Sulfidibacter corallicola]
MNEEEKKFFHLFRNRLDSNDFARTKIILVRCAEGSKTLRRRIIFELSNHAPETAIPLLLLLVGIRPSTLRECPNLFKVVSSMLYRRQELVALLLPTLSDEQAEILFEIMATLPRAALLETWTRTVLHQNRPNWTRRWLDALIGSDNATAQDSVRLMSQSDDAQLARAAHKFLNLLNGAESFEATEPAPSQPDTEPEEAAEPTRAQPAEPCEPQLVFAIDDSRTVLMMLARLVKNLGYRCRGFPSPSEALANLGEEQPALIFTDLNMPECSGLDLARQVRAQFAVDELPVVMITTPVDQPKDEEILEAGINEIVFKPFNKQLLQETLHKLIGQADR